MDDVRTCTSRRVDGQPCTARALPGSRFCFSHDPATEDRRKEGQRRGGANKSHAARAAKLWAAAGREIPDADLPLIVKALIVDVREGRVEPGTATAIANLCKTAVQLHGDLDVEKRLAALEEAASETRPTPFRRAGW